MSNNTKKLTKRDKFGLVCFIVFALSIILAVIPKLCDLNAPLITIAFGGLAIVSAVAGIVNKSVIENEGK